MDKLRSGLDLGGPLSSPNPHAHDRQGPAASRLPVAAFVDTSDLVFLLDGEGRFTFLNRPAVAELGQGRDLIGASVWDCFPAESNQSFVDHHRGVLVDRLPRLFDAYHALAGTCYQVQLLPVEGGAAALLRNVTAQRQDERRLRESEERYRLAAQVTEDLIWEWNIETGESLWNRSGGDCLGYAPDQLGSTSQWWLDHIHPADRDRVCREIEQSIETGAETFNADYRFRRADGSYAPIQGQGCLIRNGDGRAVRAVGVMRDLTRTKTALEALSERERQLASIFGQAMVGIMHTTPDHRVLMVNDRFCEILGRRREEIASIAPIFFTHPEDLETSLEIFRAHARTGRPFQIEKRYVRPDDGIVWCAVHISFVMGEGGAPLSVILVAEDITARRKAEEELEANRTLLQSVVDSVADLIFVKDLGGRFVLTNRALDEGCGSLTGRRVVEAFPPDLARTYSAVDEDIVRSGTARTVEEIIPIRGKPRLFHTVKVPWRKDGGIAGVIGVSRDMTERKSRELALRQSEALNRSIVEASTDCIMLMHLDGTLFFTNDAARVALEIEDVSEIHGRPWVSLWPVDTRHTIEQALDTARAGDPARLSIIRPTRAGQSTWWDVVVSPVTDDHGTPIQLVGISRDITQQKTAEYRLRWSATHDALTGLSNRTLFQERLALAVEQARRRGGCAGLLHLDLDHFKQVNDALGHDAGDALLKTFAARLKGVAGNEDTVARLGGDEFAVVLPRVTGEVELRQAVEALLLRLREPFAYQGHVLDARCSVGAAIYPLHGETAEELLKHADIALYAVKASGRGGLQTFHADMRAEMQKRTSMVNLARDAVRDGRVVPFYQPKVALASGQVEGFEALLRWQHPRGGVQAPGTIAAAFEDLEVAVQISDRMIESVVADMRRWLDRDLEFGHVAINAAGAEFRRNDFAERLLDILRRADVPVRYFQLEVTETVFLGRGAEYVEQALRVLSAEGVKIALDDFGTGFASLRHLKQFPVDILKIDRSFVHDMHDDAGDAAIVRAVINLGSSLGMKLVAEGVETAPQAEELRRLGCHYGQGYLFSRAVPAVQVPALLDGDTLSWRERWISASDPI